MTARAPRRTARKTLSDYVTEDQFQAFVIELATRCGWKVQHIRKVLVVDPDGRERWETPIEGHKGGPDLLLARSGVVLLVELKSNKGSLFREQKEWLDAIGAIGDVWRPRDRDYVVRTLTAKPGKAA